ncbi:MAG TPA: hypothetical protein VFU23_02505 [Gemmatimonadales bacterium]|nr:hypothetical protein [Gemmatimonadales bacterium]
MRRLALAGFAALSLGACRPYDNYAPLARQDGLVPAGQFARYGREQAEVVAIGRSLAKWRMADDSAGFAGQTEKASCFARRFPEVEAVDADPLGHRLTIRFKSGWRAAAVPVDDGVEPEATPGISPLGQSPCT